MASEANQEKRGRRKLCWQMFGFWATEKCEIEVFGATVKLRQLKGWRLPVPCPVRQSLPRLIQIWQLDIYTAGEIERQSISWLSKYLVEFPKYWYNCLSIFYMQGKSVFCGAQRPRKSVISLTRRQARQKKTRQSRKWLRSSFSELSIKSPLSEWRAPSFHLGTSPRLSG